MRWLAISALVLLSCATQALAAATKPDFTAAYAAAEAASREAASLRNQWTTTVFELARAKREAEAGDFDKAVAAAREAEALAKASIYQAQSEKEHWKDMEIR